MRLVQVFIPEGTRETILDQLDEEGVDYAVTPETGRKEYSDVVTFPVPTNAVEPILARLRDVGVEEDSYTVVIAPETVISKRLGTLAAKDERLTIAREELLARAEDMAPATSTFVIMTVVSAVVAATGLLLNSGAVIIGAMLIAPVMGPAVSAAVGTVVSERPMFRRAVALQTFGLVLAIVSALVFALALKSSILVPPGLDVLAIPEIQQRVAPNVLSLVLAVGAGVAAIVSVTRGVGQVLVGAMIAVALVPPAATVGICLAWGNPLAAVGALVLAVVNLLAVNLVATVVLWWAGYRPEATGLARQARRSAVRRATALIVILAVLSLVLVGVSYVSYQSTQFEQNINSGVADLLSGQGYENVTAVSVTTTGVARTILFGEPTQVAVVVSVDEPGAATGLAADLRGRIREATGEQVVVTVSTVEYAGPAEPPTLGTGSSQARAGPGTGFLSGDVGTAVGL